MVAFAVMAVMGHSLPSAVSCIPLLVFPKSPEMHTVAYRDVWQGFSKATELSRPVP
jgi:hypothetical protein